MILVSSGYSEHYGQGSVDGICVLRLAICFCRGGRLGIVCGMQSGVRLRLRLGILRGMHTNRDLEGVGLSCHFCCFRKVSFGVSLTEFKSTLAPRSIYQPERYTVSDWSGPLHSENQNFSKADGQTSDTFRDP